MDAKKKKERKKKKKMIEFLVSVSYNVLLIKFFLHKNTQNMPWLNCVKKLFIEYFTLP